MEIFNAIGLEIPKGKTLNDLAEDAEKFGELSLSTRESGVIHGRCWRIGFGLEVWTVFYESIIGEIFYADCRPGFRAQHTQNIQLWSLVETEGEATLEGCTEKRGCRIMFQLQNLTEVGAQTFEGESLTVGLCGLAHSAEVTAATENFYWKPLAGTTENSNADKTDWSLCGRVLDFKLLCNPQSGKKLYWIYLDLEDFKLEILVNRQTLRGGRLRVGARIKADVWLQGHIEGQPAFNSRYEGVDRSADKTDFWKHFRKLN